MGYCEMQTEIVNIIFRMYLYMIEKYLFHGKMCYFTKEGRGLHLSVGFQQLIPSLSPSILQTLK